MRVPGGAADGVVAQRGQRIALGIEKPHRRAGIRRVQQVAVLGRQQEDQAIHQPQELAEEVGQRALLRLDAVAQVGVGGQEAGAEDRQRCLHTVAQAFAGGGALLATGLAPVFQRAVGGWRAGLAEAAGVDQQPERGEVGERFSLENVPQVGFDVGRAGQAGVVTQQP
jgi:hypothetical protein